MDVRYAAATAASLCGGLNADFVLRCVSAKAMSLDLEQKYLKLFAYCEAAGFAGHDPFDGLNSRIFQATPLRYSRVARLAFLQAVKRSPVDPRAALLVPNGVNPKALALFALAELSRFRETSESMHAANARDLLERLTALSIRGKTNDGSETTAFGYNFDWQSRVFFAPKGTPAIVPTALGSQAFIEAYDAFGDEKFLNAADEIARFILNDLGRIGETNDEVCFSYTPVDRTVIFNASLLAGEALARAGAATGNTEYLEMAAKTVRFVIRRQNPSGAWVYGENAEQAWVDNFHTAYVLLSLYRISSEIEELRIETYDAINNGAGFWLKSFFLDDGTPKYYNNEVYPIDIHSAAVAIAALAELRNLDERMLPLANQVAEWTCANMLDEDGYFYYQMRKSSVVKTPFMRWGQAWMAYALARLIEAK
jgi:hypothetical protein